MSDLPWWTDSPPWLSLSPSDSRISAAEALPPSGSFYAARMSGREMLDADGVFTQFYEHLRLPDYFGWNWNALYDCLSDLNWIPAARYLLIVDDAEHVLSDNPSERHDFLRTLFRAAESWAAKPDLPNRKKATFRVVFLCASEACNDFSAEIARAERSL
ncbi:barstar family protein [Streptomyces sp. NPDC048436]|uniref:barstar family protein n=1 Tax=Streptomyces sp. NPDC048436 TaxID=3365550 RepID=UPI00370FD861